MAKIPETYKGAVTLGRDARACLNFARLTWTDGLSDHMREWMTHAEHCAAAIRISINTPARTLKALRARGLVERRTRWLTPLGALVHEAGTKKRVQL